MGRMCNCGSQFDGLRIIKPDGWLCVPQGMRNDGVGKVKSFNENRNRMLCTVGRPVIEDK